MKKTLGNSAASEILGFLPEELVKENSLGLRFGKKAINFAFYIQAFRPALTLLLVFGLSVTSAFAQNPFPTRGDQSLGNMIANILTIAAWVALAVGILSFMSIPICLKMKWDWMNNIWAGFFGVGGWMIAGSLGYMLANNQDVDLPELGQ